MWIMRFAFGAQITPLQHNTVNFQALRTQKIIKNKNVQGSQTCFEMKPLSGFQAIQTDI